MSFAAVELAPTDQQLFADPEPEEESEKEPGRSIRQEMPTAVIEPRSSSDFQTRSLR
jgi:hypothetical protein